MIQTMKKIFLFVLFGAQIIACGDGVKTNQTTPAATDINLEVADTIDDGTMLLGPINTQGLTAMPYQEWFEISAQDYNPDRDVVTELKPLLKNYSIKVFMGTWCEDSQREVPALIKLLGLVDFKMSQLEMVAVSHDKDTPDHLEEGYDLEYVPTIILFKDGSEVNRIVEYTQETLEKDLRTIASGQPYTPGYAD